MGGIRAQFLVSKFFFILQDMGFEPMSIAALRPERSPVTTWVILHLSTES